MWLPPNHRSTGGYGTQTSAGTGTGTGSPAVLHSICRSEGRKLGRDYFKGGGGGGSQMVKMSPAAFQTKNSYEILPAQNPPLLAVKSHVNTHFLHKDSLTSTSNLRRSESKPRRLEGC